MYTAVGKDEPNGYSSFPQDTYSVVARRSSNLPPRGIKGNGGASLTVTKPIQRSPANIYQIDDLSVCRRLG